MSPKWLSSRRHAPEYTVYCLLFRTHPAEGRLAAAAAGDAARLLSLPTAASPMASVGAEMVATTLTLAALTCNVTSLGEMPSSCRARLALKAS